ncbi:helix-turn-helix domain-containing protein [Enterobacter sp.]|uniref:helix-turn-helix domain-containing protein n=1 Tax=Enterobacter sp. TaxID=42895 RepID=UPI00296F6979|nr:helix-turn-helix domain-containing protein [Enterobacter sp.]
MNNSCFFADLIMWIESNITERLFLDDIAKKSGYSKWHLQRLFKNHTGVSLGSFIKLKKLEFASNDILRKEGTITDVAMKYGFDSLQDFTRCFTRHYGLSPSKFRKKEKTLTRCYDIQKSNNFK